MLSLRLVFFCVFATLAVASSPTEGDDIEEKIWGGTPLLDGEVPWMVSINSIWTGSWSPNDPFCTGVIISARYILTSVRCSEKYHSHEPTSLAVFAGTIMASGVSGTKHQVVRFFHHENYDPNTFANDISVWEIYPPIEFSQRAYPIGLPLQGANLADDFRVTSAGFGRDPSDPIAPYYGSIGKKSFVSVVGTTWCRSLHGNYGNSMLVTSDTVCAGSPSRGCESDLGGPLYHNGVLYGIMKNSRCGPGEPNVPSLFTKVSMFVDWIREKTGTHPSS